MGSLGDRIKRYERAYNPVLTPRTPVIIRVDGRSFHTYTKGRDKPFDRRLMGAMVSAMAVTADEMQGFRLAYHQSDEVTFLITDYDSFETQGWFNYELNKIVSITASVFTEAFARFDIKSGKRAHFDARAFNVPVDDVPNVFVWRQQDWERNSVQMLARAHFSHKELEGKKVPDMLSMLFEKDVHWEDLLADEKHGTFYLRNGDYRHQKADWAMIDGWITHGTAMMTVNIPEEFERELERQ